MPRFVAFSQAFWNSAQSTPLKASSTALLQGRGAAGTAEEHAGDVQGVVGVGLVTIAVPVLGGRGGVAVLGGRGGVAVLGGRGGVAVFGGRRLVLLRGVVVLLVFLAVVLLAVILLLATADELAVPVDFALEDCRSTS